MNEIIQYAQKYLSFEKDKKELEKILSEQNSDDELKKMAEIELKDLIIEYEKMKKLKLFLLPKDDADKKNAIIEIRCAGTGGLEASLFVSDLFKMYEKISNKKKWSLEIISISRSEAGGLKEVIALIKGIMIIQLLNMKVGFIEFRESRIPKPRKSALQLPRSKFCQRLKK